MKDKDISHCPINGSHPVRKSYTINGDCFLFCGTCKEDLACLRKNNSIVLAMVKDPAVSLSDFREMSYLERYKLVSSNLHFNRTKEFDQWSEMDQELWNIVYDNFNWPSVF